MYVSELTWTQERRKVKANAPNMMPDYRPGAGFQGVNELRRERRRGGLFRPTDYLNHPACTQSSQAPILLLGASPYRARAVAQKEGDLCSPMGLVPDAFAFGVVDFNGAVLFHY